MAALNLGVVAAVDITKTTGSAPETKMRTRAKHDIATSFFLKKYDPFTDMEIIIEHFPIRVSYLFRAQYSRPNTLSNFLNNDSIFSK